MCVFLCLLSFFVMFSYAHVCWIVCTGMFLSSSLVLLFLRCVDGKEGGMCCKLGVISWYFQPLQNHPPKTSEIYQIISRIGIYQVRNLCDILYSFLAGASLKEDAAEGILPRMQHMGGRCSAFFRMACCQNLRSNGRKDVRKPIDLIAPIIETHRLGTFFGASFQKQCKDQEVSRWNTFSQQRGDRHVELRQ